jgi:hypothetical protein
MRPPYDKQLTFALVDIVAVFGNCPEASTATVRIDRRDLSAHSVYMIRKKK